MGRLIGALNTRANAIYAALNPPQQAWAQRICLKLVRTGQDAKDTRQRQSLQTLLAMGRDGAEQKAIRRVVNALVNGRLLVAGEVIPPSPLIKGGNNEAYIDLAHEALMAGWDTFAQWRQQNRDLRRLVQRVEDAEKEWQRKGQDERYLLQEGLLAEVRKQWDTLQRELNPATQRFYQHSDEQEKEQIAFLERALAESELREKALKVMNLLPLRPHEGAAQGIVNVGESHRRLQERVITPTYSGLKAIFNTVRESGRFQGHAAAVLSVAFSPDGQTIVSGSSDQTVRLCRGSTWRDWLTLCCNRFYHHPLFKHPDCEPFISACQVCDEYVWSQKTDETG